MSEEKLNRLRVQSVQRSNHIRRSNFPRKAAISSLSLRRRFLSFSSTSSVVGSSSNSMRWPAFGNNPPLRLPGGDEENLRRAGFRETIGQSAVLHPNSMFLFDYFFARWNLSYPPRRSSIQAGPTGASKRSLITKTRCETLHRAPYALMSVSAVRLNSGHWSARFPTAQRGVYPRSEPDCTTRLFPRQINLTSGRRAKRLHQYPACGGLGSGRRDNSERRLFRPWFTAVRPPGSARADQVLEDLRIWSAFIVRRLSSGLPR